MDPLRYIAVLRRWQWVLLAGMLLPAIAAYLVSQTITPTYRATAVLFLNQTATPGSISYTDALLNQQLAKTYSRMAQHPVVLDEVLQRLQLPFDRVRLGRMISVQPVRDTQLIEITVDGSDPPMLRDIADAVASVFIEQQTRYLPADQVTGALFIAQNALLPVEPIAPRKLVNTGLAAVLGLVVVLAVIALREYLDNTVKTPEDLDRVAGLPSLGMLPKAATEKGQEESFLAVLGGDRLSSEAYRLVRTNLEFAGVDHPVRTLLVTSAGPSEGKSTVAANLATVLAQAGQRVILVDCDLRRPNVHRIFGAPNQRGMTSLLLHDIPPLAAPRTLNGTARPLRANGAQPSLRLEAHQQSVTARSWVVDLLDQTLVPLARTNGTGNGNGNGHHPDALDVQSVVTDVEPAVAHPEPSAPGRPMHARWIAEYLQPSSVKNLRLLTSGPLPPNPAELLSSPRLANCLQHLTTEAEVVVIDSPPVLAVSDPLSLASRVDATMLIVDTQKTRADALKRAAEALTRSGTRILGAVLNNMRAGADGGLYYTSYYGPKDAPVAEATPSSNGAYEA